MQNLVAYERGTEPAFSNEMCESSDRGIYRSIVSGKPLFSSKDKIQGKEGYPTFSKPISDSVVAFYSNLMNAPRTEIYGKADGIYLGQAVEFGDEGVRYVINSASLQFEKMEDLNRGELEEYGFNL